MSKHHLIRILSCIIVFISIGLNSFGQTKQVINPDGGASANFDDGLKVVVNTSGYLAVYRANVAQYCCGNIYPSGDTGGVALKFRFSNGTTYSSTTASWSVCSTTPVVQNGNDWATSINGYATSTISGKKFFVTMNFKYTYPNKYFLVDYFVRAPFDLPGSETVHIYLDHDANIKGSDGSRGYMTQNSTGHFVGDYRTNTDNSSTCARYSSGVSPSAHGFKTAGNFRSYYSGAYSPRSNINGTLELANVMQTANCIDDGIAVEFTVGALSAGQTGAKQILHGYGDNKGEFDNTPVVDPVPPTNVSTPVSVDFISATISELEGDVSHPASNIKIVVGGGRLYQEQVCNFSVISGGTAVQNTDFTYVKGFIIPVGDYSTPKTLTLDNFTILGNTNCQNDRTIKIQVDSEICNDLVQRGTTTTTTYTIADDDVPTVNQPSNKVFCDKEAVAANTIVFTGSTLPNTTYSWTNSNTAIGLAASGAGNIPVFTATNTTTAPITATITVTPKQGSCTGDSKQFTITVNPTPTVSTVLNNQTYCNSSTSPVITLNSATTGTTYAWTNTNALIGLAANGTGNIPTYTATNTTASPITATIRVTPTANGCVGTYKEYTITVNPTPAISTVLNNVTYCNNLSSPAITLASATTGTTYAWTNSNTAIGLAVGGSGNIPAFTAINSTASPITATIRVTPTANGCIGTYKEYTITVNPTPAISTVLNNVTYCNNSSSPAITLASATTGTTYAWTNSNTSIGLAASGSGNIPSFTATNTTANPITATIRVTPTANSCTGTYKEYTITIRPIVVSGTITGNPYTCDGDVPQIIKGTATIGGSGTFTYQWQSSANGTTGWATITGATGGDYTPGVLTQNTYFKRISIDSNSNCGSVESNVFLITKVAAGINFTWKSNATDHNWNNPSNWTNTGGLVDAVPTKCSEVHIPSTSNNYPSLDGNTVTTRFGSPITDKITFHFGGQVAYPHKLTYNKAFVQYNWGYYAGSTLEQPGTNAEGASAKMITREKWYMLAAPLKKMASGDFAMGGYPLTWQSLYNAPHPSTGTLVEGDFSTPFSSNDIDLSTKNNALAVKVACYNAANIGYNDQCHLEGMRGILEIPYFENSAVATYHPGHVYNKIRKESRFYYFDEKTLQQLASPVGTLARGNEAYRFVFEDATTNKASNIVVNGATVPGYSQRVSSGTSAHNTVMIGNPFMATINSRLFFEANSTKLKEDAGYYMLTPTNQVWSRYEYRTENKIPALQAVVVTLADGLTSADLVYPLEGTYALTEVPNLIHVRTATTSGSSLYIRATSGNDKTSDYAILNTEETGDASVVSKMIYPASHSVTEAFIVSSDQEYNLIDFYKGDRSEVGLGIKSSNQKDVLSLEFENVASFKQATGFSPVLVDKYLNIEQDLSSNNVYRFNQRKTDSDKQYTDANRFSLRLASGTSGIIDETKAGNQVSVTYIMNQLEVSSEQGLIQVDVYDLQGRHMHSSSNLTGAPITYSKYLPLNQGVYIVKVKTSLGNTVAKKINAK